jgi:C4-dicarboxylate transporter, DctM subunit
LATEIAKISFAAISRATWLFLGCNILILFVVSSIPEISLWLPSLCCQ